MQQAAILEAFAGLSDPRRGAGQRHTQPLCLALFTLAVAAGNKGFLAIGDWIGAYPRRFDCPGQRPQTRDCRPTVRFDGCC